MLQPNVSFFSTEVDPKSEEVVYDDSTPLFLAAISAMTTSLTGLGCYFMVSTGSPSWTMGVVTFVMVVVGSVLTHHISVRFRKNPENSGNMCRPQQADVLTQALGERGARRHTRQSSASERRVSDSKFRSLYSAIETVVAIKGFAHDVVREDFDVGGLSRAFCAKLSAISQLAQVNNGRIDMCNGSVLFISFASRNSVSEALRAAYYSVRVKEESSPQGVPSLSFNLSDDDVQNTPKSIFSLNLTAGVRRGTVLKGRIGTDMQSWSVTTCGAANVAEKLADACTSFHVTLLIACDKLDEHASDYQFFQVDYIQFGGTNETECIPIYAVEEGSGIDADLAVLWLHLQAGEIATGAEILEGMDRAESAKTLTCMKQRIARVSPRDSAEYRCSLALDTFPVSEDELRRAKKFTKGHTRVSVSPTKVFVFLVFHIDEVETRKFREGIASFTMAVERANGVVESVNSDRFVARWCVGASLSDCLGCAVTLVKVFDKWSFGIGLCKGEGVCVEHRGEELAHSTVRVRAECLAVVAHLHKLRVVADADLVTAQRTNALHTSDISSATGETKRARRGVQKESVSSSAGSVPTRISSSMCSLRSGDSASTRIAAEAKPQWRPISYDSVFVLPAKIASQGLVHLSDDVNPMYLRAMGYVSDRCWASARDLLQQYSDLDESDAWAQILYNACCAAFLEEESGARSSDDPLVLQVNRAGAQFVTTQLPLGGAFIATPDNPALSMSIPNPLSHSAKLMSGRKTESALNVTAIAAPASSLASTVSSQMRPQVVARALRDREQIRINLGFHNKNSDNIYSSGLSVMRHRVAEAWNLFRLAAIFFECTITPARAFYPNDDYTTAVIIFVIVGTLCDVAHIGDVILNFYEPVTTNRGIKVTNMTDIAAMYVSSWLAPDIIACLPWELFWVPFNPRIYAQHPWVRVNRLMNVLRIPSQVIAIQETYAADVHPVAVKLVYNMLLLAFILYWMGCMWGTAKGDTDCDLSVPYRGKTYASCISKYFEVDYDGTGTFERVIIHLHWALRGFAGYGQGWPETDKQHLLCIVNVVLGIAIFATVIAYLQSTMKMTHNEVFLQRLDAVVAVAEHRRLDEKTTADILRYHRMLWSKTQQVYEGQFENLKEELPAELAAELTFFSNLKAFDKIDVLHNARNPQFLTRLISSLVLRVGSPGELLLERGDPFNPIETGIYFFYKGCAFTSIDSEAVETVHEGGYWGEISCLLGVPQPADCRLLSYCELYFLPALKFKYIIDEFPEYANGFVDTATRRRQAIRLILTDLDEYDEVCVDVFSFVIPFYLIYSTSSQRHLKSDSIVYRDIIGTIGQFFQTWHPLKE